MQQTAVFTGGGSAGHVTPNFALMRALRCEGWSVHYIGTAAGIEKTLLESAPDIRYHTISAGKLRRYFSLKNVADVFRVARGTGQAKRLIKRIKPSVVFSKGGYVSVPVVLGARKICPVVVHESDYTPGLSNRIANRFASKVCVTFEDTLSHLGAKGVFTGTPIRKELYDGDRARGLAFTKLGGNKPVIMMMGGGLGAKAINDTLRQALPALLPRFDIVHLCGKGKLATQYAQPGYVQYEYIDAEQPDLFALADIVLSRAGANAIFEFLALKKPALLVPLPLGASRGDQIQNAAYFEKKGYAAVLKQEDMTADTLTRTLVRLYEDRQRYIRAMAGSPNADGTGAVLDVIRQAALTSGKGIVKAPHVLLKKA
ncbi:MAG: undecaprenyldiphospho-muramoylpentapeptide beta-N-acetylglucosaminyltransferase [Clostridiales bacterium]|jgi:UDP-N-acetylglucosamine--N-acetylmuramyl-(pentapeptide) pyrophosphoryl-undecaprenol N-acetylglucosamine transferase|nr:undecaprenyldiphospho-muramoylpentapeptide beta-N-acetylglucosaminyltransferase [Clostridiales bacterium]